MPHAARPTEVAIISERVESLGLDSVWVPENCFLNGGVAAVGLALNATREISVGLGVMPAPLRHPASAAMEMATIAQAHTGRFSAGFGLGVPAWLDQMGLRPRRAVPYLRAYVTAVRRLLMGETVTVEHETSEFSMREITLAHPPGAVPIALGVVGPKMLALAGEVADTVILSTLAGPRYVTWAVDIVERAAAAAGRARPHVVCFAAFNLGATSAEASDAIRADLAFSLQASGAGPLTDPIGSSDEVAELLQAHPGESLAHAIPTAWIDELAVTGDRQACAHKVAALWASGADEVVLAPKPVAFALDMLSETSSQMLPLLNRRPQ